MRIVHITTVPESLGFLKGQLGFMQQRGHEVAAISAPGPYLDAFGKEQGIETVAVPMARRITPLKDLRTLVRLTRELRRLRPTIVHAHTPKGGLLGVLAGLAAGVPVRVYHMRGLPLETARGAKRALLRWTERVSCGAAHQVICVSHSLRQVALQERLCRPGKMVVLAGGSGNGVDANGRFDPDRVGEAARYETREKHRIPRDAIVIGFLGRLVRDKGVLELLDAFQALSEQYPGLYLLVGGMEEERDSIPDDARRTLREHQRIRWIGMDWNSPPLYAAMDVVVLPTYREGFPNVPLEAAAMRLPVVATRVSGCVDAVADGRTGILVPARDAEALRGAIQRYLDDPGLRRVHGDVGRARVLVEFRRELIWQELHARYTQLVTQRPGRGHEAMKRAIDVGVAATVLTVAAVPLLAIGVAVAATMGRPVIFAHDRPGKDERLFKLYKFRTMADARGPDGELLPDGERITKLGAFLRRTSLDELPELINVLRGEMSLVGPRPLLVRYLPHFTREERLRHSVRPGITGWAQVHGRNEVSWDRRIALDVWYVQSRTLRLDLEILLATALLVLKREGVVVDPRSTMLNFDEERILRTAAAPWRGAAPGAQCDALLGSRDNGS